MLMLHFRTPEGLAKMRQRVEEEIESFFPQVGDELDKAKARIQEIKQTIGNLVENLTSTNREYVDARLIELKRELAVLESKSLELESSGAEKTKIGQVIDQAIELAGEFKTVFAEGSIEEKRLFLRAFLKKIELDPVTGKGQVMLNVLPGMQNSDSQINEESLRIDM
jgi:hypothetical protein